MSWNDYITELLPKIDLDSFCEQGITTKFNGFDVHAAVEMAHAKDCWKPEDQSGNCECVPVIHINVPLGRFRVLEDGKLECTNNN